MDAEPESQNSMELADIGVMICEGQSAGCKNNVCRVRRAKKPKKILF